jgi:hypothetical protein
VLRFAHVTNQMGRIEGDFENGTEAQRRALAAVQGAPQKGSPYKGRLRRWRHRCSSSGCSTDTGRSALTTGTLAKRGLGMIKKIESYLELADPQSRVGATICYRC